MCVYILYRGADEIALVWLQLYTGVHGQPYQRNEWDKMKGGFGLKECAS